MGMRAVRKSNLLPTCLVMMPRREVEVDRMARLPETKSWVAADVEMLRISPSLTALASVLMAVLPAAPSKATFFSSAVSIVPPKENTSACHIQLPVISQSSCMLWVLGLVVFVFLVASLLLFLVVGFLSGFCPV